MNTKNKTIWKGVLIGLAVSFGIILFASYASSYTSFKLQRVAHEENELMEKRCGIPPSNDCLMKICEENAKQFYYERLTNDSHITLGQYVESSCSKHPDVIKNGGQWRYDGNIAKPSLLKFILIPNIKNGLEAIFMFGIFGIFLLIIPPIIGFIIAFRKASKSISSIS